MEFIYLLLVLLLVHFAIDLQFQSEFVAKNKHRRMNEGFVPWYYVMTSHVACHALAVGWLLNPLYGALEFVCHFAIDVAKCEGYTNIHVDQGLHVACKVAWVAALLLTGG